MTNADFVFDTSMIVYELQLDDLKTKSKIVEFIKRRQTALTFGVKV